MARTMSPVPQVVEIDHLKPLLKLLSVSFLVIIYVYFMSIRLGLGLGLSG